MIVIECRALIKVSTTTKTQFNATFYRYNFFDKWMAIEIGREAQWIYWLWAISGKNSVIAKMEEQEPKAVAGL
jgi:hypothetical protein